MLYFVAGWIVLGLLGFASYVYMMKSKYPDYLKDDEDWDMLAPQIFIAILGGPIVFLSLIVIFGEIT